MEKKRRPRGCVGSTTLEPFGQDIWIAAGTDVSVAGFSYPTRMAVIRLPDDSLFIWSPIRLTNSLRRYVESLGTVHNIVAPNSIHHLFISGWKRTYPSAGV